MNEQIRALHSRIKAMQSDLETDPASLEDLLRPQQEEEDDDEQQNEDQKTSGGDSAAASTAPAAVDSGTRASCTLLSAAPP